MDHDLTLIVGGAATEHPPVANDRFKRAGLPEVNGIARLYVVVAVDHHRRQRAVDDLLGNNNGVATRLAHLYAISSDSAKFGGQPLCGGPAIRSMFRERRDTWDLQELSVLRHPSGGRCDEMLLCGPLKPLPGGRRGVCH